MCTSAGTWNTRIQYPVVAIHKGSSEVAASQVVNANLKAKAVASYTSYGWPSLNLVRSSLSDN